VEIVKREREQLKVIKIEEAILEVGKQHLETEIKRK
jgi:hypothetical protein